MFVGLLFYVPEPALTTSRKSQILTAEQKEELIFKDLTARNPQAPHNLCQFSFKDRIYKLADQVDQIQFHHQLEGCILLKDSEEATD